MSTATEFQHELEKEVGKQLRSQRVGYLLGAGSSYLASKGYPLTSGLWRDLRERVRPETRGKVDAALAEGATGIEQALDQLDDGGALDTPHRHEVTSAIAELFRPMKPPLELHCTFVERVSARSDPYVHVFSLNYDPLIERAADCARVRLADGFRGFEDAYFDPAELNERPFHMYPTNGRHRLTPAVRSVHLLKLHGSLGWYEVGCTDVRRSRFDWTPPSGSRLLMVPPQRRKDTDTMHQPYAALWTRFRGCLTQGAFPIHRLVSIGYGFGDHHVNEVIAPALARSDFTLLIFARELSDEVWTRWSPHTNSIVVTEQRCSLYGTPGGGHQDLWDFQRIGREV